MEIILLGIYSFFVWLIFLKFKWLPWNIVSQVIVITLPIIGLTALILLLNIVAPSSHDVRVALLRVQSEQLSQRANLHLALGGSWESPAVTQASAATTAP